MDTKELAKNIREGLLRVLPIAEQLAKLTATRIDDDTICFLRCLIGDPSHLDGVVAQLQSEGKL